MRVIRLNRAQKVQTVKLAVAQTGQPKPEPLMLSPLSEEVTKALWSHAEELPEPPAQQPESFPPPAHPLPHPGRTVELEWNQQEPNALPSTPLNEDPPQVVSKSPMGELESVQQLVVTFSRPVIALGAEIGCKQRVSIQPAVKGYWHWLDAQTLSFFGEALLLGPPPAESISLDCG